jgi:hypothetical protein
MGTGLAGDVTGGPIEPGDEIRPHGDSVVYEVSRVMRNELTGDVILTAGASVRRRGGWVYESGVFNAAQVEKMPRRTAETVDATGEQSLADYKAMLARMLREKAEHWEQIAAAQRDDDAHRAACLAYRGAYCDAANLIEYGEVAW